LTHVGFLHERERIIPHNDTVSCDIYIVLCMDGDIHNSNFMTDNSCTKVWFLVKIVHIGNFSGFEDAFGNAASSAVASMMSVIMVDEVS